MNHWVSSIQQNIKKKIRCSAKREAFNFIHIFIEKPEEPYDSRSLFEQLKQQRDKKDLEFDEAHKLSKMNFH